MIFCELPCIPWNWPFTQDKGYASLFSITKHFTGYEKGLFNGFNASLTSVYELAGIEDLNDLPGESSA